ncbi:multidrug effflux MFS transporter [Pseudomonas sp. FFUP_PS_473]|uniref:multidrug effflux MFS transporter n=1 Tax=Pseudomonas sp. FFUP_PS_473 TaxID=2060418 RepID=UPI001303F502|nr:multidrug effflux MFS transporter [Pseudomonas sp. FFUP_PS_473]
MNTSITLVRPVSASLLWLLGSLAAIAPLSTDMYLPAFALIRADIGAAAGEIELSFSAYFIGMLIGMLCYGPVSDQFGRKRPLLFGLALYVLAGLAITQVHCLATLVVWRFVQGIGGCAGAVLTFAIIRDRCDLKQSARNLSLLVLIMGAAPVVAPLLGSWVIAVTGWRGIFWGLAVFGGLMFLGVWRVLDDPRPLHSGAGFAAVASEYRALLAEGRFMTFVSVQAVVMAAMFSYIIGSPLLLIDVHRITPEHFGYFFGANALGVMLAGYCNRLLLPRFTPLEILRAALLLPMVGGTLLVINAQLVDSTLWLLLPGLFLAVIAVGFVNPNASALAMAAQERRAGKAAAILNSATFGGGMLVGLLLNLCYTGTTAPVAWLIFACGLLAVYCGRWL